MCRVTSSLWLDQKHDSMPMLHSLMHSCHAYAYTCIRFITKRCINLLLNSDLSPSWPFDVSKGMLLIHVDGWCCNQRPDVEFIIVSRFNNHFAYLCEQPNDCLQPRVPVLWDRRRTQPEMLLWHWPLQWCMALCFSSCPSTAHHLICVDYILEPSLVLHLQAHTYLHVTLVYMYIHTHAVRLMSIHVISV